MAYDLFYSHKFNFFQEEDKPKVDESEKEASAVEGGTSQEPGADEVSYLF